MASVDPFVIPIPQEFMRDDELRRYYEYLHRFLHDIWQRTGGGTDAVSEITNSETYETSMSSGEYQEGFEDLYQLESEIPAFDEPETLDIYPDNEVIEWECHLATEDYTATDHDIVEARNGVKITLSESETSAQIITGNGDGSVITIDGGQTELRYAGKRGKVMKIRHEGTFIHWFKFFDGATEYWRGA